MNEDVRTEPCPCCDREAGECDCEFKSTHEKGHMPMVRCKSHGKMVWEGEP